MKNENNFWKTFSIILIVVLVVGAVIVFWRNPELSPNAGVIKVAPTSRGTDVYTKAEIDAKFDSLSNKIQMQKRVTGAWGSNYTNSVLLSVNSLQSELSLNRNPTGAVVVGNRTYMKSDEGLLTPSSISFKTGDSQGYSQFSSTMNAFNIQFLESSHYWICSPPREGNGSLYCEFHLR